LLKIQKCELNQSIGKEGKEDYLICINLASGLELTFVCGSLLGTFFSNEVTPSFPTMIDKPPTNLPHTDVYILDSSLALGYFNNDIPGWRARVNHHILLGKKFLLLQETVQEVTAKHNVLPEGFEQLKVILNVSWCSNA
jgi:hypothetical protein